MHACMMVHASMMWNFSVTGQQANKQGDSRRRIDDEDNNFVQENDNDYDKDEKSDNDDDDQDTCENDAIKALMREA